MKIRSRNFGYYNNKEIKEYILYNGNNLEVKIISLGATIKEIHYRGLNTVLGFENLESYVDSRTYFGALIGRVAGRISKGEILIDGKEYKLSQNEGTSCLHGGYDGYSFKIWEYVDSIVGEDSVSLELSYASPNLESGFPGEVVNRVKYTVDKNDTLSIEYFAKPSMDSPITITNHSYFNLNGDFTKDILDHTLMIDAEEYIELDEKNLPIKVSKVEGTPFDFRSKKPIRKDMDLSHDQLRESLGYDHPFILNKPNEDPIILSSHKTGIQLRISTTEPVVILYCSNNLKEGLTLLGGEKTIRYQGVCLETQWYPDAINQQFLPNNIIKAGEEYYSNSIYKFSQI